MNRDLSEALVVVETAGSGTFLYYRWYCPRCSYTSKWSTDQPKTDKSAGAHKKTCYKFAKGLFAITGHYRAR